MTFSFRRRRDTWDSAHERARYRAAERVDGMIDPAEEIWLEAHLAGCAECRAIADEYTAQHRQLRASRGQLPEAPRDLWARTASGIEQEAARSIGRGRAPARRPVSMPMGAISGLLVIAVVLGAAFLSRPRGPSPEPRGTEVALQPSQASFVASKTPMPVTADVDYVKLGDRGTQLYQAKVREVCSEGDQTTCPTIPESSPVVVELPSEPEAVIQSPTKREIIVISSAEKKGASLVVVPVPAGDSASPSPGVPTPTPTLASSPSVSASPSPTPGGPVEVLGAQLFDPSAAYSPDGKWFAFSARPADGKHGPDIYVVKAGSTRPIALTSDHRSVFGSWLDNLVIGSRLLSGQGGDKASHDPGAVGTETFAVDPATGASATVEQGLWRPTIDPSHKLAVYWNGALGPDSGSPGATTDGSLVIGAWPAFDPATLSSREAAASGSPSASEEPSADEPSSEPSAAASSSTEPSPSVIAEASASVDEGVQVLERGPILDWDARWDETGTHLAVWIATSTDRSAGVLSLYVLDSRTGRLISDDDAIKKVPALPGFSIGSGRLAYATPVGQDAKGSSVRVQAWTKDGIGEGSTEGGQDQVLVVR